MIDQEREPIAIDRDIRNVRSHIIVEFEQAMSAFGRLSPKVSWLDAARRFNHAASVMDRLGLRTVAIAIMHAGTPLPANRSLIKYPSEPADELDRHTLMGLPSDFNEL